MKVILSAEILLLWTKKKLRYTEERKHTTSFNKTQTQTFDFVLFSYCSQGLFSCDTMKFDDASNTKKPREVRKQKRTHPIDKQGREFLRRQKTQK